MQLLSTCCLHCCCCFTDVISFNNSALSIVQVMCLCCVYGSKVVGGCCSNQYSSKCFSVEGSLDFLNTSKYIKIKHQRVDTKAALHHSQRAAAPPSPKTQITGQEIKHKTLNLWHMIRPQTLCCITSSGQVD